PEFSGGSFEDPRFELVVGDARAYIEATGDRFDVIILDLPESLEGGPAGLLYTREFYQAVKGKLNQGGIMTSQSDNASWGCLYAFPAIVNTIKQVFPIVRPYQASIPSFGGMWGFCAASVDLDPLAMSPQAVDTRLSDRAISDLKYYDGLAHQHVFSLPKHLRQRIDEERRVISDTHPLAIRVDYSS
ncbi:MAG: spermidine synthase, partial [Chloroflexi bacterium]|nr:spermidine synthase [Chloroflexota bacterium]